MKLYRTLARSNIRSNRRLYVPYLLTGVCMVMIFYIILFLSTDPELAKIPGGGTMQIILWMGVFVVGIFSAIFLFYTSSFIIKRRRQEFGLYNVLGMEKRHIGRVMLWETGFAAGIAIGGGLALGILLCKLAQLFLLRMMDADVTFSFAVPPSLITTTAAVYAIIYLLILLHSLRQVYKSSPIELLRGSNKGEKPPKANYLLALLGLLLLGVGYWLAVTVQDPIEAIIWFFVAVVLVILGTYCCFVAGSVTLLRLLRGNRRYYYQTRHFVSVSGMSFRMKRNGAGLASICILSTMVLVMLSSVTCLYAGKENVLDMQFPRDIIFSFSSVDELAGSAVISEADIADMERLMDNAIGETPVENRFGYRACEFAGYQQEDTIVMEVDTLHFTDVWMVHAVPLADYNRLTGANETLAEGEALLSVYHGTYDYDHIRIGDEYFRIHKQVANFLPDRLSAVSSWGSLFLVVQDIDQLAALYQTQLEAYGSRASAVRYTFGCDAPEDAQIAICNAFQNEIRTFTHDDKDFNDRHNEGYSYSSDCRAREKADFFSLYGGLFFLGILLGFTFMLATVLIMYYKQVTEGYEDRSRFGIMQKVGLTRREIRASIHSQMLTVFLLPLLTAALHVLFAFPLVEKLLRLFAMDNRTLFLLVTLISFGVFAVFYVAVYTITSRTYLKIVSEA